MAGTVKICRLWLPWQYLHIKPGNLLLATDGTLKISDFGVAAVSKHAHCKKPIFPINSF